MGIEQSERGGYFDAVEILLGLSLLLASSSGKDLNLPLLGVSLYLLFDGLNTWSALKDLAHSFGKDSSQSRE